MSIYDSPVFKEAAVIGTLCFADLQTCPTEGLDFAGLIAHEFQQLARPYEPTFQDHIAYWRLEGKPRVTRPHTT
jgi:hypothetical protein